MWKNIDDNTKPVITACEHIASCHKTKCSELPETALLFFMRGGIDYLNENYQTELVTDKFPSFLNSRPIYRMKNHNVCFLNGGWGAPMAADTLETLKALGVKKVVSAGMFGAFGEGIASGDAVVPDKAFVEEGTSLHYFESIEYSLPDEILHNKAEKYFENSKSLPIVSTDAVYRQTFYKENVWRNKGAVGVDMETSALFSVGKCIGLSVVSVLIASDIHPISEKDDSWKWKMTKQMRYEFFDKCIKLALNL